MTAATVRSTLANGDVIVVGDDGTFTTIPQTVVAASCFRLLRVGQRLSVTELDGMPTEITLPA